MKNAQHCKKNWIFNDRSCLINIARCDCDLTITKSDVRMYVIGVRRRRVVDVRKGSDRTPQVFPRRSNRSAFPESTCRVMKSGSSCVKLRGNARCRMRMRAENKIAREQKGCFVCLTGCIHCNRMSSVAVSGGGGGVGALFIAVTRFLAASFTEFFHSEVPSVELSAQAPAKYYYLISDLAKNFQVQR